MSDDQGRSKSSEATSLHALVDSPYATTEDPRRIPWMLIAAVVVGGAVVAALMLTFVGGEPSSPSDTVSAGAATEVVPIEADGLTPSALSAGWGSCPGVAEEFGAHTAFCDINEPDVKRIIVEPVYDPLWAYDQVGNLRDTGAGDGTKVRAVTAAGTVDVTATGVSRSELESIVMSIPLMDPDDVVNADPVESLPSNDLVASALGLDASQMDMTRSGGVDVYGTSSKPPRQSVQVTMIMEDYSSMHLYGLLGPEPVLESDHAMLAALQSNGQGQMVVWGQRGLAIRLYSETASRAWLVEHALAFEAELAKLE